jgi:hypothetical protein
MNTNHIKQMKKSMEEREQLELEAKARRRRLTNKEREIEAQVRLALADELYRQEAGKPARHRTLMRITDCHSDVVSKYKTGIDLKTRRKVNKLKDLEQRVKQLELAVVELVELLESDIEPAPQPQPRVRERMEELRKRSRKNA